MNINDRRKLIKAATPMRDRVKDSVKMFFIKLLLVVAAITILCLISYNSWKGN
jgi:hypothetical protein